MKKALFLLLLVFVSLHMYAQQPAANPLTGVGNLYKATINENYGQNLPQAQFYKVVASMIILDSNSMLEFSSGNTLTRQSKKWVDKMTDNSFVNGTAIDYASLLVITGKNQVKLDKYANPTEATAEYLNNVINYKYCLADAQARFKQHQHTGRQIKVITPQDLVPPTHGVEDTVIAGTTYFRVLSWKSSTNNFRSFDSSQNMRCYNSAWQWPLFVTVAPELRKWYGENKKTMDNAGEFKTRLAQLLGMPPGTDYGYMIALWVRYEDLFRPTYDSSIARVGYLQDLTKATTHPQYLQWLQNYFNGSYTSTTLFGNYPFTGLGYTYDCSPDNFSHIGMSEFITKANTRQYISAIYTTEEYYELLGGR